MKKIFKPALIIRVSNYLKDVSVEAGAITVILIIGIIILSGNIFRVITNARANYSIFQTERDSLYELRDKNSELDNELKYVQSDEYKKLFLRDTESLGTSSEQLYNIKESPEYYEEIIEYLEIEDKKDFTDWWIGLFQW
jgi:hypothetical protein